MRMLDVVVGYIGVFPSHAFAMDVVFSKWQLVDNEQKHLKFIMTDGR